MDFLEKYNKFVKKLSKQKKTPYTSILRHKTRSTRLLPSFTTTTGSHSTYIRTLIRSHKQRRLPIVV